MSKKTALECLCRTEDQECPEHKDRPFYRLNREAVCACGHRWPWHYYAGGTCGMCDCDGFNDRAADRSSRCGWAGLSMSAEASREGEG